MCFWQAQLVSHAQQMGMDDSGTKNDLVERLLPTLSIETVAQPSVQANGRQVALLACTTSKPSFVSMICLTILCTLSHVLKVVSNVQEEVLRLKAEVAELDSKLIAVTLALTEATTAREDERYPSTAQL